MGWEIGKVDIGSIWGAEIPIIGGEPTLIVGKRDYAINIQTDSTDENLLYIGKAEEGSSTGSAVWQIMRIDSSTGTIIVWASGNSDFDKVFDDRESLSYF